MNMTIRQSATIHAQPKEVFETLMDSRKLARLTKSKASMSRKIGGKYRIMDGWIMGENIDIIKNRHIKQSFIGKDWPADHSSQVTFDLKRIKGGTKLMLTHRLPNKYYRDVKQGWKEHYMRPIKDKFNAG